MKKEIIKIQKKILKCPECLFIHETNKKTIISYCPQCMALMEDS